eukprot:gene16147-biopygen21772
MAPPTPQLSENNSRRKRPRARPGRVCYFKFHRVGRVRDTSAAVSPSKEYGPAQGQGVQTFSPGPRKTFRRQAGFSKYSG